MSSISNLPNESHESSRNKPLLSANLIIAIAIAMIVALGWFIGPSRSEQIVKVRVSGAGSRVDLDVSNVVRFRFTAGSSSDEMYIEPEIGQDLRKELLDSIRQFYHDINKQRTREAKIPNIAITFCDGNDRVVSRFQESDMVSIRIYYAFVSQFASILHKHGAIDDCEMLRIEQIMTDSGEWD